MPKLDAVPDKFAPGYLDRLDGRTAIAAEMRQRWLALTADLGGEASLSYAQRSLCERALWLEHWLAVQERALADGRFDAFDAGKWTQACNALQGILVKLGLQRVARDVTPDLQTYLAQRARAAASDGIQMPPLPTGGRQ